MERNLQRFLSAESTRQLTIILLLLLPLLSCHTPIIDALETFSSSSKSKNFQELLFLLSSAVLVLGIVSTTVLSGFYSGLLNRFSGARVIGLLFLWLSIVSMRAATDFPPLILLLENLEIASVCLIFYFFLLHYPTICSALEQREDAENHSETDNKQILWVTYLRVFAIFAVVLLHTATPLLHGMAVLPRSIWWTGNLYNSGVLMSVPLLFMISGFLLLTRDETLVLFFQKRVNKIILPLIVWTVFYMAWKDLFTTEQPTTLRSFITAVFTPAVAHLWFLYALLGIYLFVPILRIIVFNTSVHIRYYYILLWFLAAAIIPMFGNHLHIKSAIDLKMISGYTGYLMVGLLLGNFHVSRNTAKFSLIAAILCVAVTAAGIYDLSLRAGEYDMYYCQYTSPNVVALAVSVFILCKYAFLHFPVFHHPATIRIARMFGETSMGIYLLHAALLAHFMRGDFGFTLSCDTSHPWLSIPVTAVVTFVLSFGLVWLMRKNRWLRKIVP